MRALRRFTVRAQLPPALAPLQTLATNLRWSWHAPTHDLFATLDPDAWERAGQDPVRLLGEISTGRFEELASDAETVVTVRELADDLASYLNEPRWYQSEREDDPTLPAAVGYFSMEFGVSEVLPNYSGGLGVLAGDHLKSASDLGVPLIGVGLLYRSGYFRQSLSLDGWQLEHYPALDPQGLPLQLLVDDAGEPVLVEIAMPARRTLKVRVWQAAVGRVPLLLLDSDIEENDPDLRGVTDRLYGGDQDQRIRQEILVGIGGVRAVRAFCAVTGHPEPEVFHTNEGHAGYLGLERIRELQSAHGLTFDEAVATVRAGTVFTTHTPVPAGIDRFPVDMVKHYFGQWSAGGTDIDADGLLPGVPTDRVLALGAEANPNMFNMAHMGLRLAQRANGVSQLHGAVSRGMFGSLWEGFDADEVPIGSVTNGVHGPTWEAREVTELIGEPGRPSIHSVSDEELWHLRGALRARLVTEVRRRVREAWLQRGASTPELGWTDHVFDPGLLTVGFARRVPTYKRLTLMLRDKDRLRDLLLDPHRPVQLVVAGKSHPADDGGKALIQEIVRFADDPAVRHRIVFLPDYDMSMARYLYWGCDVWLNNPLRPLEACGTSGMKSALNGGLNLSIRDGWWDEFYDGLNGWAIPTADGIEDPARRDDLEANALYELLATRVGPAFYERTDGVPTRWVELVRHTLTTLRPQIQATRMVREYAEGLYAPAARAAAAVVDDKFEGAREMAAYRTRLNDAWARVAVLGVDASGLPDTPVVGAPMTVRAAVQLAGLDPSDVVVQAVVGQVDESDELRGSRTVAMQHVGPAEGGGERFEVVVPLPYAGLTGYSVRVLPQHPLLASPAELGKVVLAG
ncbi:alpha-glucan family phosphorylase [Pseudonocardia sp.]|uniref:alpha-glucan family phosphorylase n=1 Tax=Pseudonocardia sp. TaxID=60912 RepID=UPI002622B12F|nr:alpha-glucan family phosphorylase [Pseudonocardia sp.]MCW2720141.1 alpha-glucan phosphorylase [Pseudonocardia sp.]MDT7617280.1 glycogen phosphorylase [Pseudonocardiales bacterium]